MYHPSMFESHHMFDMTTKSTSDNDSGITGSREDEFETKSGTEVTTENPSGEEPQDPNQRPNKKKRYHRHTQRQIQELESFFKECPHPDDKQRKELSRDLCLEPLQVKFWFQNKRTQMKAQHERHENQLLKSDNDKLRAENNRYKEALSNATCPNCGGPAAIGEMSFDEQHLRIENARLREEIDRISAIAAKYVGKPVGSSFAPLAIHGPSRSLDLEVGNFGNQTGFVGDMYGTGDILRSVSIPSDTDKPMIVELAVAAMEELVRMAQAGDPLWVSTGNSMELLNEEEYFRTFPRGIGPKPLGLRTEASRESAVVIMNHINLVEILMDVNQWSCVFSGIVSRALTLEVLSTGVAGNYNGALQVMTSEFQVPSPLVPTRENYFVRYCKQHSDGSWAVVDVSLDSLRPNLISRTRRRPSGCLIQELPNGYSKVTWIEHMEVDDRSVHTMYKPLVHSGLAFGAKRWVSTLERQCERLASSMASNIPASDLSVITSPEGRKSMLKLAERMVMSFCSGVGASTAHAWTTMSSTGSDDVRVMTRKSMDDPGRPPGIVLSAATSFWTPVAPKRVFDFLRDENSRSEVHALSVPSPQTFAEELLLNQKWQFLRQLEECYFRQKSRITWLKEGDLNTTFFHRVCIARASYNAIRSFILANGVILTEPLEMSAHAIVHFQSVLGPDLLPSNLRSTTDWFRGLSPFLCSHLQKEKILLMPTLEEISKLMFSLNPNKAPGPDGLSSAFYKATWSLLGSECVTAIQDFFNSGFLPKTANSTILSLVPKFPGASRISEYRPISCLNTIYKVISRLLVRRLKPILQDLILPNQTAFVEGRLLVENTVLASELVNGYHKNKGSKRITIKVDIAKAFDTLSWDFLFSALESYNLPAPFTRLLRACVCTTSFMVGYNGTVSGYFKGKRGLRQGDPLSPYLFVIAMNCLSLMLDKEARMGNLSYHHNCQKTKLTHLSFADDLLIFIDGSLESVQRVLQILHDFELRSSLAVSLQKSSFFASGLTEQEVSAIQVSTGMPCGSLPMRYLGVPLCTKKLNLVNCEPLLQQIKARFSSWSAKALSFAGRLLLIKTVIAGVSTFWCSSFILPKSCINRINSLCGLFLWNGRSEGHHSAKVAWETVSLTKKQGGLGVKDLHSWNLACILKLVWMLFFRPNSVWVCWFKEVILNGDSSNFWTVKTNAKYSWLVNKMIKSRTLIHPLLKKRLGNGEATLFWYDNWSPFGNLSEWLTGNSSRLGIPKSATLASLFHEGSWRLPPARTDNQLALQIHLTTIHLSDEEDTIEWVIDGRSAMKYNTGDVYTYLKGPVPMAPWAKVVWNSFGIPRQSFLTWLVVLDRCPTKNRLLNWGIAVDPRCLLCNVNDECRDHLFFECFFSRSLWRRITSRCRLQFSTSWEVTILQFQNLTQPKNAKRLSLLALQACIYWIWHERNARLHSQTFRSIDSVFAVIDKQIRNRISSIRSENPSTSSAMMQLWFSSP